MSVYFVSDFHLGHRSIIEHGNKSGALPRGATRTPDEHDEWVIEQLLSVKPTKRTVWWILGDVAMDITKLPLLDRIPGNKRLILGNHDLFQIGVYAKYFDAIYGGFKKYNMWITHMPMHPTELWDKPNIHGHTHYNTVASDLRYLNASIEWLPDQMPIELQEVRAIFDHRNTSYNCAVNPKDPFKGKP